MSGMIRPLAREMAIEMEPFEIDMVGGGMNTCGPKDTTDNYSRPQGSDTWTYENSTCD